MLPCPSCASQETFVKQSRAKGDDTRRRRECKACGHRFTTIEMPIDEFEKIRRTSKPIDYAAFRRRAETAFNKLIEETCK